MNEHQVAKVSRIAHLIAKRLEKGVLTDPEWMEIREWIDAHPSHYLVVEDLNDPEQLVKALQVHQQFNTEAAIHRFLQRI